MMIKSSREYEKAMRRLNPGQRQAVASLEGPVLVLAGPGTGKTDVLTLRIGTLLLETQASPYNILCLTFTEAATVAMRSRLIEYIGREAENVTIQTFHGFCNRVIQEHTSIFGSFAELQPATDLESVEIMEHILDTLPEESPLRRRRGDRYADRSRLTNLINLMKQEGWSPDFLKTNIALWLEEAKTLEEYLYKRRYQDNRPGDLREKKYHKEVTDKMEELQHAIQIYDQYNAMMLEAGRYDFSDMLNWVSRKFDDDPDLLLDYQERFQYILVDEFQDTNGIQLTLLEKLTHYEMPNVFVVGDDDQAIFRFQGARVENISNFKSKYGLEALLLTENYRSSQHIVDASEAVIRVNREIAKTMKTLYTSKRIVAAGPNAGAEQLPVIRSFNSLDQEEAFLARELDNLFTSGILQEKSVAVMYRRHSQVEHLIRILQHYRVPFHVIRQADILKEPLIQNLLLMLEYLQDQYLERADDDEKLFKIMHFRHFGVAPRDIAKLAFACQNKPGTGEKRPARKILRDLLNQSRELRKLKLTDVEAVKGFSHAIDYLCGHLFEDTLAGFFERILYETGLLKWIMEGEKRWWNLRLIQTMHEQIIRHAEQQPHGTLEDFLTTIERHRVHNVPIAVKEVFHEEQGIHLLTAHGAKGLQFDHVYMIACTKSDWEDFRPGKSDFTLPGNVVSPGSTTSHEDERRLFYVAMTRARTHLYMSWSEQDGRGKKLEPSRFITECLTGSPQIKVEEPDVAEEVMVSYFEKILQKPRVISHIFDHEQIDTFLETYRLSATDLNKYLECPTAFYFEKILRIPSAQPEYLVFGNVIHKSFERLFKENWNTLFLTTDSLLKLFEHTMEDNKWKFTKRQYDDLSGYGRDMLSQYGQHYEKSWRNPVQVETEYRVKDTSHRGVPLKGYIDKIEIFRNGVHLRDYKTGAYRADKFKRPNPASEESGGDSWRQMMFYRILLAEDNAQDWQVKKGIMDFVDFQRAHRSGGEPITKEILFPGEDIRFVSDQIVEVYDQIRRHVFEPGCEKVSCYWCQLVKTELSK